MDPISFISLAPAEFVPALIVIGLVYKVVMYWLDKRMVKSAVSEELNKPDVEG